MPRNFYDDEEGGTATADEEMPASPDDSESAQEVVSVSFLKGAKPGDHCEIKVDKIDGDSALVSFVKPLENSEKEPSEDEGEMGDMMGRKSSYYD